MKFEDLTPAPASCGPHPLGAIPTTGSLSRIAPTAAMRRVALRVAFSVRFEPTPPFSLKFGG